MNKKKLLALIAKKEARKAELGNKATSTENVAELRSINDELASLNAEIAELRSLADVIPLSEIPMCQECGLGCTTPCAAMNALLEIGEPDAMRGGVIPPGVQAAGAANVQRSTPAGQLNVIGTYGVGQAQASNGEARKQEDLKAKYETRGADLKNKKAVTFELDELPEFRAVTIGGGTLITQEKYSNVVNPKFSEVSTLIDQVNAIPLIGGESYTQGFEVHSGEGDYTTETGNYVDADPTYDYVTIGKAKITAYAEISDEAMKLPNVDYQSLVAKNVSEALRKKITKQILAGPGGANALTGIFNAPANVIPDGYDLEVSAIDANTLDKIVLGYGGDEDVETGAVLVLSKKDLAAFAAVRSTTGEKLYKIKKTGNTGTISSEDSFEVPFIINSACAPLSSSDTAVGTFTMAYGILRSYEMPVFSPITVEESRDFKFKTGQIAYRSSVWAGGNVASYKGFIRVKKAAAV